MKSCFLYKTMKKDDLVLYLCHTIKPNTSRSIITFLTKPRGIILEISQICIKGLNDWFSKIENKMYSLTMVLVSHPAPKISTNRKETIKSTFYERIADTKLMCLSRIYASDNVSHHHLNTMWYGLLLIFIFCFEIFIDLVISKYGILSPAITFVWVRRNIIIIIIINNIMLKAEGLS